MRLITLIFLLIAPSWVFAEDKSIAKIISCDSWKTINFDGQQSDEFDRPFFLWKSQQGNYYVRDEYGDDFEFASVLAPDFSAPEFSGYIGYRQYADDGGVLFFRGRQLMLITEYRIKYTTCTYF